MLKTVERRRVAPHKLYGAIVSESSSLVLLHQEVDFQFDGYVVIRRRDITKLYPSESTAYCERLMRKEGTWSNPPKSIRSLPISTWFDLFSALMKTVVILENERRDDYWIGPVIDCDEKAVVVHYFTTTGRWLRPERVPYRFLTTAQFGGRYSTIHARHLPPRPS
jgi:hypothetical protein